MRHAILLVWLLSPGLILAEDERPPEFLPDPPDLPPPVESGETLEPDITIIRRGKQTIQEYRVNGKLYMVKINPDVGPAYYLLDTNGDGNMDVRRNDLERNLKVPQWVIFSW